MARPPVSDPHGWEAQKQAVQAQRQAAQRRSEQEMYGAAAAARRNSVPPANAAPRKPADRQDTSGSVAQAAYWGAVAYCPVHNLWGCAFRQGLLRRALYEAHSAASRHGSQWCPGLLWTSKGCGYLSPGYMMAFRSKSGMVALGAGRSKRSIAKKLHAQLGKDADVLLLVSVRKGVLAAEGLDLQVGWTKDMPGGM